MTYRDGWGVYIEPIWGGDDDDPCESISDVEIEVIRLAPVNEAPEMPGYAKLWGNFYVGMAMFKPLEDLWQDDTHDLRSRWFESRQEAIDHAEYTRRRWENPSPWESFVKLG
jgi:hypothetical protein